MSNAIIFNGDVPRNYQDILTPLLFDHFSTSVIDQLQLPRVQSVLELACGTGSLTRQVAQALPAGARLTATDLQEDMLAVAKQQVNNSNITWHAVDMTAIPFANAAFDLVLCQFGIMLVPDKAKALQEIHRVLQPGGRLVFTVWADMRQNPAWDLCGQVIARHTGGNPMLQDPGPFSLADQTTATQLLQAAGFSTVHATLATHTGQLSSAAMAAKGFIEGLPVYAAISKKDPALVNTIQADLTATFTQHLGDQPFKAPSAAWVFEAVK